MNPHIVRSWMTPNPIAITLQTTLPEARRLMEEHFVRRLPVINKGRLVGIVTRGDIREAQASTATTLSVYELNYLLDHLTAKEFMAYEPITISADATISEAARRMQQHKIGALPVVEYGELVGIITESDLCRLLITQSEYLEKA
jgi:acetoin utilization protein AcuB